jgi:hypothetical protein
MSNDIIPKIQSRIYKIRNCRVILDFDLAALYEVETKALNRAVKRNIDRFPEEFMFRLSPEEWERMRYQIGTASQIKRNIGAAPHAFSEYGIVMLASVLRSNKAIQMNIIIVKAFIALRELLIHDHEILNQLMELRDRIGDHDVQLSSIYDALENMLDKKQVEWDEKEKWSKRQRIGFKK